jgi:hypothetical protein
MAIPELLFLFVKIIILSAIYATLLLLLAFLLSKAINTRWTKWILVKRSGFWLLSHFVISVFLFAFSFSYWQDTGLGDNSKIPVGYGQTIQSEDFASTYFYPDPDKTEPNKDELIIENYIIAGPFLCALVSHQNTHSPDYDFIIYDLEKRSLKTFNNEQEYSSYAAQHSLPQKTEFYDFRKHYQEYLENKPKWKRWLLP